MNIGRKPSGMGAFQEVANYGWLYNPPPYNFLDSPSQQVPNVNFYAPAQSMGFSGLGCAGSSCGCNKGAAASGGGLGLFDGGMDLSSWGWAEYAAIVAGLYILASSIGDSRTAVRKGRKVRTALKGIDWAAA